MDAPLELIVSTYTEKERARQVLEELKRAGRDGNFDIKGAAVIVKDEKGRVQLHETDDVGPGRGALFGAITGGLIGLLAGPAGVVMGAIAGAATGGAAAVVVDMGFSNDQLKELQASMPANSSALVLVLEHTWVEKLVRELEQRRGRLFRHDLNPQLRDQYDS